MLNDIESDDCFESKDLKRWLVGSNQWRQGLVEFQDGENGGQNRKRANDGHPERKKESNNNGEHLQNKQSSSHGD